MRTSGTAIHVAWTLVIVTLCLCAVTTEVRAGSIFKFLPNPGNTPDFAIDPGGHVITPPIMEGDECNKPLLCGCPVEDWTPEDQWMCGGPSCEIVEEVTPGSLISWIHEHCFPEEHIHDECFCIEAQWANEKTKCECEPVDNPVGGEVDEGFCDRAGDSGVDCSDMSDFVAPLVDVECVTREDLLDAICCFLKKCGVAWDGADDCAKLQSILSCASNIIGDSLTPGEVAQIKGCAGLDCDSPCCSEIGSTGVFIFACGPIDCDPNGDGNVDCDDLKDILEDSETHCNGGTSNSAEDQLAIVCEYFNGGECEWTPPPSGTECGSIIDCIEDRFKRSLTPTEIVQLEDCVTCSDCCKTTGTTTNAPMYSCGDNVQCERTGDDQLSCEDLKKFIEESKNYCNSSQALSRAQVLDLVAKFLQQCNGGGELCQDVKSCIEDALDDFDSCDPPNCELTQQELTELGGSTDCPDLCDPSEQQNTEGDGNGCAKEDPNHSNPTDSSGVDVGHGDQIVPLDWMSVTANGGDVTINGTHTSNPDYDRDDDTECGSGGLTGEGWSMSPFEFVKYEDLMDADTLTIGGSARSKIVVSLSGSAPWKLPGATAQTVTQTSITIDGGPIEPVWRIAEPGQWEKDYYRTGQFDGLLRQSRDMYGNVRTYLYSFPGLNGTGGGRLVAIYVNGTPQGTTPAADAVIQFAYFEDGSVNEGRVRHISEFRDDDYGLPVAVQTLDFTYMDESSAAFHADLGTDGDLIQVVHSERVDPSFGQISAVWRKRITQYRYHGGVTNETSSDTDGDGFIEKGNDHQIKMVILPEQIEYYAQSRAEYVNDFGTVDQYAAELLDKADAGTFNILDDITGATKTWVSRKVADLAATVNAQYETSGDKRLLQQFVQSSCGCGGGATQGLRRSYTYHGTSAGVASVVEIDEDQYDGALGGCSGSPWDTDCFAAFRTTYYELYKPTTGGPLYLKSKGIVDANDTDLAWVTVYEHNSTTRTLTKVYMPSAVYDYDPLGGTKYLLRASSGLIYEYTYTSAADGNRLQQVAVRNGTSGSLYPVTFTEYGNGTGSERKHLPKEVTRYRVQATSHTADEKEATKYSYGFHTSVNNDAIAWVKTEIEAELVAENGPSSGSTWYAGHELFDTSGDNFWSQTPDGSLTKRTFDATTGRVLTVRRNADKTADGLPGTHAGLSTSSWPDRNVSGQDDLLTKYFYDMLGRVREVRAPGGVSTYTLRRMKPFFDRPQLNYYCEITLPHAFINEGDEWEYAGPATETYFNADNDVVGTNDFALVGEGYEVVLPTDPQQGYDIYVTDYELRDVLQQTATRYDLSGLKRIAGGWHSVPGHGWDDGTVTTVYQYDTLGRVESMIAPNQTSHVYTYDVLNRVVTEAIGTATSGRDPQNTLDVVEYEYDHTGSPAGVGDGNLTRMTQHVDSVSGNDRVTEYVYDWRNRRTTTVNPLPPNEAIAYDNLGRVTERALFEDTPSGSDPFSGSDSDRGQYTEMSYSQRGLNYKSRIAIDPTLADGSKEFLETNSWFDEAGRTVGRWGPNAPMSKTTYDGLGRVLTSYVTDRHDDDAPGAAGNFADVYDASNFKAAVTGDVVLEQTGYRYITTETTSYPYNSYKGLLDLVTARRRAHTAADTMGGDLSLVAGGDVDQVITTYQGYFYDGAHRIRRNANYGTNSSSGFVYGGTAPTVNQTSPPSSSTTVLVTETEYDNRGLVDQVRDPESMLTKYWYDDLYRSVGVIEGYKQVDNVKLQWSDTLGRWEAINLDYDGPTDENRVTSYVLDGAGNTVKQIAHLPDTDDSDDKSQVTVYAYGVTTSDSPLASTINSNDVLRQATYPDGGLMRYSYNRQGEALAMKDQNGTVHEYTRDDLGRSEKDLITSFASGIDTTIDTIATAYDELGRVQYVRSKASATIKNAVKFEYNTLWQVTKIRQDIDGDIVESGGGTSPSVTYDYDKKKLADGNYARRKEFTYPNGVSINYIYEATSGDSNTRISRLWSIQQGSSSPDPVFARYEYIGLNTPAIVGMNHPPSTSTPSVLLTRFAAHNGSKVDGTYPAFDRFGRVTTHKWVDFAYTTNTSAVPNIPPIVEFEHTYDRASNRTASYDNRPGSKQALSSEYTYDDLHRLIEDERGTYISGGFGHTSTTSKGSQKWTLDILGNWIDVSTNYSTGDSDYSDCYEKDDRQHLDSGSDDPPTPNENLVNELSRRKIVAAGGLCGSDIHLRLFYDANGSIKTQETRPNLPGSGSVSLMTSKHDGWNRLVLVQYGATPLDRASYAYNGLNWLIVKKVDTSGPFDGTLDLTRERYYGASWQLAEERIDDTTDGSIDHQVHYVWGARYIDDIVMHRVNNNPAPGGDNDFTDGGDEMYWHLTDVQFSTVAVLNDAHTVLERVNYEAYGEARHHQQADVDGDGDTDSADLGLIPNNAGYAITNSNYRVDADLDRDGMMDSSDYSILSALISGGSSPIAAARRGQLSTTTIDNIIGWDGYVFNAESGQYTVRHRWYDPALGRWVQRDPTPYVDGCNSYQFVKDSPLVYLDLLGLLANENPNGNANGCCTPERLERIYETAPDLGWIEQWFNVPWSSRPAKNLQDILDDIQRDIDAKNGCACVSSLEIAGHGSKDMVQIGEDDVISRNDLKYIQNPKYLELLPDLRALKEKLDRLKGLLCEGATVRFVTCETGPEFAEELKKILGNDKNIVTYCKNVHYERGTPVEDTDGGKKKQKPPKEPSGKSCKDCDEDKGK